MGPHDLDTADVGRLSQGPPLGGPSAGPAESGRTGRTTGGTRGTVRTSLGTGLVEVPEVQDRDPFSAVLADPSVPESKRFCGSCGRPVGRSRDGAPGRTEGFCPNDGAPFSFDPKLRSGDLVAAQYEVVGCLAHGGLGWIYLAKDRNVGDEEVVRWVVLKGLLNSGDEAAMEAALSERRFLAEVDHPNLVKILNFAQHDGAGYIVMAYVNGTSLRDELDERRRRHGGTPDPLPVALACEYILRALPALAYLHDLGLLYCDFKPDNVIHTPHGLTLIDLGAVYRAGDTGSPMYGTTGYQAPEIAETGPLIASDLFTVARTLAVLCIDFRGYQSTHRSTLPTPDVVPEFARWDSLYRLILKGTAKDPADRYQSAGEMAEQVLGVLREVVAEEQQDEAPRPSSLFTGDHRARPDAPDWRRLPVPRVLSEDEAAGFLATMVETDPDEILEQLSHAPVRTVEVQLREAQTLISNGNQDQAERMLDEIEAADPSEWRASWWRGVAALAGGGSSSAYDRFFEVYRQVPGELAPKLALGVAAESGGEAVAAEPWYEIVSRTDRSYTTATFGLARCLMATGQRPEAIAAYERIPETSIAYVDARIARTHALLDLPTAGAPATVDILEAGREVEALGLEDRRADELTAEVLEAALDRLSGTPAEADPDLGVLGHAFTEPEIRRGLEQAYRRLAREATTVEERIALVDHANAVRPRTWT